MLRSIIIFSAIFFASQKTIAQLSIDATRDFRPSLEGPKQFSINLDDNGKVIWDATNSVLNISSGADVNYFLRNANDSIPYTKDGKNGFALKEIKIDPQFAKDSKIETEIRLNKVTLAKITFIFISKKKDTQQPEGAHNFNDLDLYVKNVLIKQLKLIRDEKRNLLLEGNVIHVFLNDAGDFLSSSIPTTAVESNTYAFHVVTIDTNLIFSIYADGEYKPAFNILTTDVAADKDKPTADNGEPGVSQIIHKSFGVVGPYTDKFHIKINKVGKDKKVVALLDRDITIAKLYYVSISTGLLATTLRNPSSIEKLPLPGGSPGDTTLVANDPKGRGIFSVMATYYPTGRSFLLPPSGGLFSPERFGIVVGAQLNDKLQENFLGGLSFDFARGGSITFGAHYGRRNYIAGYNNFKFGQDHFTGKLVVKQEWALGFFIGVTIDTRVALKLFNIGDPQK